MTTRTQAFCTGLALTLALAAGAVAQPAASRFGVGVVLGDPSGLSLKIPSGAQSVNIITGWDLNDGPGRGNDDCCESFYIGADYIFYNYNLIRVDRGRLPLYYGPGVNVSVWDGPGDDNVRAGIRMAVGLEYQFATAPFDIFLEIAPGVDIVPDTDVDIDAGLGGRFFF